MQTTSYDAATHKAEDSWQLIQLSGELLLSKIAIAGLRPEDDEVGSNGS